jgi:DNA-binding transcriptional ArsR family regulator
MYINDHLYKGITMDRTLTALADPTRRAILAQLTRGEATVGDLARPFAISQPAMSHHIKVLEQAGLIRRRVDGQRRPIRLVPQALAPLEGWLRTLRDQMERNYQRLDDLLADPDTKDRP